MEMPTFSLSLLQSPVCGLAIALLYGGLMYKLVQQMLDKFMSVNQGMLDAFRQEIEACEKRYDTVLTEMLQLKELVLKG